MPTEPPFVAKRINDRNTDAPLVRKKVQLGFGTAADTATALHGRERVQVPEAFPSG